jgi:hypothetical protein
MGIESVYSKNAIAEGESSLAALDAEIQKRKKFLAFKGLSSAETEKIQRELSVLEAQYNQRKESLQTIQEGRAAIPDLRDPETVATMLKKPVEAGLISRQQGQREIIKSAMGRPNFDSPEAKKALEAALRESKK